jgi:hypothetical protein
MDKMGPNKSNGGSGFRLRHIPEKNLYQIHSGQFGAFEGPLRLIWQKMHWEFEIPNGEIRFALSEMAEKGHNVANFGIFGTFMYTDKN